ncbi:MAG: hypothetical protein ACOVNZ_12090 [Crocinitomicaceae bacterium]
MEEVKWDYPTIKNLALERYDNELVLDYAPRCYAETKDLESFFKMMDGCFASVKDHEQRKLLREKLNKILQLKIQLLDTEGLKENEMLKQNYERVSELRTIEKSLHDQVISIKDEVNGFISISNNPNNQNLKDRIVHEVNLIGEV